MIDGDDQVKAAWCRGYADGDGTVGKSEVCLDSVNVSGLSQVKGLLQSIGIVSKLNGPYVRQGDLDRYGLVVHKPSLPAFSRLVGFNHPRKKYELKQLSGGPVALDP